MNIQIYSQQVSVQRLTTTHVFYCRQEEDKTMQISNYYVVLIGADQNYMYF